MQAYYYGRFYKAFTGFDITGKTEAEIRQLLKAWE